MIALLVGVANACALGGPDLSRDGGDRLAILAGQDHANHTDTGRDRTGDADGSHRLKPACQKFCDDEAAAVVKHDKAFKFVSMVTSATRVDWWLPASETAPLQAHLEAAPLPELPLTMRFMRLTI